MKRLMCIGFPNWPIQRRWAARPADRRTLVVYAPTSRGKMQVLACSRDARRRGVRPGMLLADAQALWPAATATVRFEPDEPSEDREALRELALWCGQFTPSVAVDDREAPDCLLLDVTGCWFGFGTEEAFAGKVITSLDRLGYWGVAAVADTAGAARALARHGFARRRLGRTPASRVLIVPPDAHGEALRPLPVEALGLPGPAVQTLHELNVFRIDQLLALPRSGLPSRFGPELLLRIDQALGAVPEVLRPERAAEPIELSWQFEPPVADGQVFTAVIEQLLERLLQKARRHQQGVRQLLCSLKPVRHEPLFFPVERLRPTASLRDLVGLVRLQFERLRVPAEVSQLTVRVPLVAPLEFQQEELFGGTRGGSRRQEVAGLLERLSSRLGERAVLRPRLRPDAQPELAHQYDPWLAAAAADTPRDASLPRPSGLHRPASLKNRPLTIKVLALFPEGAPRRFRWGRGDYRVGRSWGPERIETGWWRGEDVRRDYFVVETVSGERFWVFRNLADGKWFLHGIFA